MFWLKLIAVGAPFALIVFGISMLIASTQDGDSDTRGPTAALGELVIFIGIALGLVELLVWMLVRVFA